MHLDICPTIYTHTHPPTYNSVYNIDRDGLSLVQVSSARANPAAVSSLQVGDAIRVRWVDGSLHSGRFYGKYELVKYQVKDFPGFFYVFFSQLKTLKAFLFSLNLPPC